MPSLASNLRPAPLLLLYVCTALLILGLLATNAAVILHLRESELLREENQLKNLSLTLAEQASRSFQSIDLVVSSVAEGMAADGAPGNAALAAKRAGPDIHAFLREKISGVQALAAVSLISSEGKLVNFSRYWPVPDVDVADREYFRALRDDPTLKSYVSAPVQNRVTGGWTIFLARRIDGANGGFQGIVIGAIEMQYFEEFYRAIALPEGSSVALQRSDGVMLVRFPRTDAIGKAFSRSEHFLQDGISGTIREPSPIDGHMRLKAAHLLASYPVFALATKTEEAALHNWRGMARLMALGALGGAVAIAVAAFACARQWKQQAMLSHAQAELRSQRERTAAFEAMQVAKEAAETADRAKSEFLANMSHELRTPLNAVLGFSEMMVGEVFGPLGSDRYRGYAQDIHTSGRHLLSIVNDVLDLSKAAAGKLELVERRFDARDVVNSVCHLVEPRVDAAKLSLQVKMPPGTLTVRADERLLKQMLLNLLSNACKFTPPGGRVECSVSVNAAGMTFAVTDTGIGIPAEDLDRVRQPFVQVDSSLTRRHEGTGLGLALVRAMAELHGGSLRLDSVMGQGTTAAVILPLSRVVPASADIPPETATASRTAERATA